MESQMTSLNDPKNRRNYVHRKKYLNDCISQIKATLEFIRVTRGDRSAPDDTERQATAHAQEIEAACWSPRSRLSAETYQQLMLAKTQELCRTFLRRSLTPADLLQFQKISSLFVERPKTPQPPLPVPILPPISRMRPPSVDSGISQELEWIPGHFFPQFDGVSGDISSVEADTSRYLVGDDRIPDKGTFSRFDGSFEVSCDFS
jgi:hypothetical protein